MLWMHTPTQKEAQAGSNTATSSRISPHGVCIWCSPVTGEPKSYATKSACSSSLTENGGTHLLHQTQSIGSLGSMQKSHTDPVSSPSASEALDTALSPQYLVTSMPIKYAHIRSHCSQVQRDSGSPYTTGSTQVLGHCHELCVCYYVV